MKMVLTPKGVLISVVVAIPFMLFCSPLRPATNSLTVNKLIFVDSEIAPWKQDTVYFIKDSLLYNYYDGGAGTYISQGLVETAWQDLSKDSSMDTLTCRALIMDFGTSANATAMFDTMAVAIPQVETFSSFPESVAVMNYAPLVGNTTYAHFGEFFLQLDLLGYGDKSLSVSDAETFVKIVQLKIPQ